MSKSVLISGIGGFIGSHLLEHLLINTDWNIIGIDSFRHKGITDRITDTLVYNRFPDRVKIITHDLIAPISPLMIETIGGPIDYIINMASESHVDRSIVHPVPFIKNNVDLVLTMLEYARIIKPKVFIQISTDEVYGPMNKGDPHPEWDTILPSNPYSASKAAQEAIAISYWRTYGVPLVITNTMNIIGEMQDSEKFVPKIIKNLLADRPVPVHCDSDGRPGSRFYLHARNLADAWRYLTEQYLDPPYAD